MTDQLLTQKQDGLLHPTVYPGQGTGCVVSSGINHGQLFGWEFMISFVLVMTGLSLLLLMADQVDAPSRLR